MKQAREIIIDALDEFDVEDFVDEGFGIFAAKAILSALQEEGYIIISHQEQLEEQRKVMALEMRLSEIASDLSAAEEKIDTYEFGARGFP